MKSTWIHCPNCGHRMFFLREGNFRIEIKCTSCKQILRIDTATYERNRKEEKKE